MVEQSVNEDKEQGGARKPRPVEPGALRPRPPKPATPPPGEDVWAKEAERNRRTFIWYGLAGFFTVSLIAFARFFFPRALFEPKTRFSIGYPDDYGFGVDTKWQQEYRIWVCRNAAGLYVIFARCTHLGCTPDWKPSENKFKCPCHGSGFDSEGINFEGPAPKPLLRCHLAVDPTGEIIVDKLNLYEYEQYKDAQPGTSGPLLAV